MDGEKKIDRFTHALEKEGGREGGREDRKHTMHLKIKEGKEDGELLRKLGRKDMV